MFVCFSFFGGGAKGYIVPIGSVETRGLLKDELLFQKRLIFKNKKNSRTTP